MWSRTGASLALVCGASLCGLLVVLAGVCTGYTSDVLCVVRGQPEITVIRDG